MPDEELPVESRRGKRLAVLTYTVTLYENKDNPKERLYYSSHKATPYNDTDIRTLESRLLTLLAKCAKNSAMRLVTKEQDNPVRREIRESN